MTFKTALGVFTKSELLNILEKVGATDAKTSWKKDQLTERLATYSVEMVCDELTSAQLKDVLDELELDSSGNKAARFQRIQNHFENSSEEVESQAETGLDCTAIFVLAKEVLEYVSERGMNDVKDGNASLEDNYNYSKREHWPEKCPFVYLGLDREESFSYDDGDQNYRYDTWVFQDKATQLIFAVPTATYYRSGLSIKEPYLVKAEPYSIPMVRFTPLQEDKDSFSLYASECKNITF